jgi:hypothetical protein
MTTASHRLAKFQKFLNLEASRSLGNFAGYLGRRLVEWSDKGQFGQLTHLTQCTKQAHANLFALADSCLSELKSVSGGSAEFEAMEQTLVDHAEQQRGAVKDLLWPDKAPNFTNYGFDMPLNVAADHIFDGHANELHLWLDKERLDYQELASADDDKLTRSGRPPAALWDKLWAEMGAQLYNGDLKPENQAQIEKAMLDWAALKEIKVSESSVRTRARLLWVAISKEDKN